MATRDVQRYGAQHTRERAKTDPLHAGGGNTMHILDESREDATLPVAPTSLSFAVEHTASILSILEGFTDAIFLLDAEWRFVYLNARAAELLERAAPELIGQSIWVTFPALVGSMFDELYHRAVATGEAVAFEAYYPPFETWVEVRAFPSPAGLAVHFHDITARKAELSRLQHLATHDALTGLPNRALFLDRLTQALARAARDQVPCAVLYLDLDHFKAVNDRHGHAIGDQLLVAAAGRLRRCLREGDTLARLGGDEFTVLLERATDAAEVEAVARRLLATSETAFVLGEQTCRITVSIGGVLSRLGHTRPEDVLLEADLALYRAKDAGRAAYVLSDLDTLLLVEECPPA
jgi:diguanylate cyclase (GGDEF)-like protein